MVSGSYRVVEVLRRLGMPEHLIRRTLYRELGLTPQEADDALESEPSDDEELLYGPAATSVDLRASRPLFTRRAYAPRR